MNNLVLEEASVIKRQLETEDNRESNWDIKTVGFWKKRYNDFLAEHKLTDLDVSRYMYPSSYR